MQESATVPQCSITHDGIEIYCDDRFLKFPPDESAMMLYHLGYISRYSVRRDSVRVVCDIVEELVRPCGSIEQVMSGRSTITWDYFSRHFKLDDLDAIIELV